MKLQSQTTLKLDPIMLRRLAETSRPRKQRPLILWIAAGLAAGTVLVFLLHGLS
jgi:hypothetical protein